MDRLLQYNLWLNMFSVTLFTPVYTDVGLK